MNRIFLLLLAPILFLGCINSTSETDKEHEVKTINNWIPPAAGTVVDAFAEATQDGQLNKDSFKVIVVATTTSNQGHFDLKLEYGSNKNETTIDLPQLSRKTMLKPVLKKGNVKYECLIGFDAGDGVFKEFYMVSVEKKNIKLKQTNYYYATKK